MRFPLAAALLTTLLATTPLAAQAGGDPRTAPSPTPTRVVARSGRLVTARTTNGGTQSFNCKKPSNAKRKVCRG
ncbi:hypothetical protein [Sphingomonas bacterium]|uniref:hypothetical protein n=1 Tax=Sphingomonas bacterium TaxID=1895847 RepID=UPI0015754607|nr:hypothetical protein [Sphingomonas bacterium]